MNDGIPETQSIVHYANIQDAISFLKIAPNSYMANTDVQSAFCILPIHPSHYHLLGFTWRNQFYFDKCLPMGLAASCQICETFSSALKWLARKQLGALSVVHVLDDFLFIEQSAEACANILSKFSAVMQSTRGSPRAEQNLWSGNYNDFFMHRITRCTLRGSFTVR